MKRPIQTKSILGRLRGLAAVGVLLTAPIPTFAVVVGSYVVNPDSTVTYSYEVNNSAGSFDISVWSLEFGIVPDWDALDAPTGDVAVPNSDWIAESGTPTVGIAAQDFLSLAGAGVLINTSLSGFSFTSAFLPGPVSYFEFSDAGDSAAGQTIGPALAPTHVPDGGDWRIEAMALLSVVVVGAGRQVTREGQQ